MGKNTPMMQQYMEIKRQYEEAILFFRLGDFYEMFFEDAQIASKELNLALTSRDRDKKERVPMCGVPFHAADGYIARLISKGYKVAICEQVEEPGTNQKLVRREVVRVITPGTVTDTNLLEEKNNNFLGSLYQESSGFGLAVADVSTGEFKCTEFPGTNTLEKLNLDLARLQPKECLVSRNIYENKSLLDMMRNLGIQNFTPLDSAEFDQMEAERLLKDQIGVHHLNNLQKKSRSLAISAAGALLGFLNKTQKNSLSHINKLLYYNQQSFMLLDNPTRHNLEITRTIRDHKREGSLLGILDCSVTAMGGRLLKQWLEEPLLDQEAIEKRLEANEELVSKGLLRLQIRRCLKKVYDLDRLMGRVSYGHANARDLLALKASLEVIPNLKRLLTYQELKSSLLQKIGQKIDPLEDLVFLLINGLQEDPPLSIKDGEIIKKGYHQEVDLLRKATVEGKQWITSLESEERKRTGIKSLKIGFNKVFGYYLEVTKSYLSMVPEDYLRKQTLVNTERYITPRLKELEKNVLGAEERLKQLEYELFKNIREQIRQNIHRIQSLSKSLATLDVLSSLAECAVRYDYRRPQLEKSRIIEIKDGRHPVVERNLKDTRFVPNDTFLNDSENRIALITGPNMAGKSTYMRQVALIVLLAQVGSFVPASKARIGIVDRIFTRVGASDDLATGQSTFMVEMLETANILKNATPESLIILDEVGRGTSTYDGLSIARSIVEYIQDKIKAKTLFSTHYHELTSLEQKIPGIKNYTIAIKEQDNQILFLRRVIPGKIKKSYGVNVARLSGLPEQVIERAARILKDLENNYQNDSLYRMPEIAKRGFNRKPQDNALFETEQKILKIIRQIDISTLTPLEALNMIYNWQQKMKGESINGSK